MADKKYVIFNKNTGKFLAFCEMQPVWVNTKIEAPLFTIDEIRLECWLTFRNQIRDISWEVA